MNAGSGESSEGAEACFVGFETAAFSIRPAGPDDVEILANLVRELAIYEKIEHRMQATPADFRRHLFGPRPAAEAVLVEVDGKAIGFALWHSTFSTFQGRPGLYLEDIFVRPEFRGRGIGKALLAGLARLAVERDCGSIKWIVLDWNEPAISFYRALGAGPLDEWTVYQIRDEPLRSLAELAQEFGSSKSVREDL